MSSNLCLLTALWKLPPLRLEQHLRCLVRCLRHLLLLWERQLHIIQPLCQSRLLSVSSRPPAPASPWDQQRMGNFSTHPHVSAAGQGLLAASLSSCPHPLLRWFLNHTENISIPHMKFLNGMATVVIKWYQRISFCQQFKDLIIAWYWMLGAGALGGPRGMEWGGRREEGSGWGTHVYLWRIHFDIWQD